MSHRHGYKGRKFGREKDQRRALIKNLADSLVVTESIETTQSKAKELIPYMEKLITKAKKADLNARRQIISSLTQVSSANKLVDEIGPKLGERKSGHLTVVRTKHRVGDNVQLAKVSFIFDSKSSKKADNKPAKITEKTTKTVKAGKK